MGSMTADADGRMSVCSARVVVLVMLVVYTTDQADVERGVGSPAPLVYPLAPRLYPSPIIARELG
jgi:hypothetical protein